MTDSYFDTVQSPLGELFLAATSAGLCRIAFATESQATVERKLTEKLGSAPIRSATHLAPYAEQLAEYLRGERVDFTVPLDHCLTSGFRRTAQLLLQEIPYGTTATYAELATLANNPKAVRAVGTACATNPLPLILPCHRVVRSDGSLGGYRGGLAIKKFLLRLERENRG